MGWRSAARWHYGRGVGASVRPGRGGPCGRRDFLVWMAPQMNTFLTWFLRAQPYRILKSLCLPLVMLAALVVLILIVISNYSALFFCCLATDYYGLWLQTYHRKNLKCLIILVQNGLALYATWTSIASLINFSLVLHLWGVEKSTAATASLCILFAEVVGWFILENWVLDRWVRNILTVYPVVIVALVGIIYKHFNPTHPTPNSVFMVVQLVLACILLVSRLCTVIWKSKWRPLYSPGSARLMVSPLDGSKFRVLS
ncbi:uncharacterized protein PAE49_015067 isoform 2-T2 [Odontesthes bonariensis]|uniref:uncharacterized protein LOC142399474 isoform X2 n=1 Tax=Odontesthes bonariensis TaxID=219752 RepID=UPI003F586876